MAVLSVLLALWFTGAEPRALQTSPQNQVIEDIRVLGNRRISGAAIKNQIQSKRGDVLNPAVIQRDVRAIYALGQVDDVKVNAEDGEKGGVIVSFVVQERPFIRRVEYMG